MPFRKVRFGGTEIEYELTRKSVKNLNLRLRRDGSIALSVPRFTSAAAADAFVLKNAQRLLSASDELKKRVPDETEIGASARCVLLEEMTALCRELFPVFGYSGDLPEIKIRAMRSRWGSCNSTKRIVTFSTMLAAKPLELKRYVAAHELCHLAVPNHSRLFWKRLSETVPDCRKLRDRLNGK